ncbi:sigma-70 family RNA polymerase sigma factor [Nonomuraea sp. NPDC050663]|uniref:sigma-70 family RNA polymerase sigma factor n=1 Tax=Nonomuraea sp. NPDC050663 TaxID=3364370 RepID=UPI003797E98D
MPTNDPSLSAIMSERRRLINLAYRLLGSLSEAEDVVQETYVRWYALSRPQQEAVESVGGWMTTVASRICLNLLASARSRRERYVGQWIPEPLPEPGERPVADPADQVTLDESVNMAFLVVLEAMTPAERVAFVLHDVFRYSFAEVAEIVGRTPAACRQLASSARRRVRDARPAAPAGVDAGVHWGVHRGVHQGVPRGVHAAVDQAGLVAAFKRAWQAKDIAALIAILDPAVTATGDGGGLVSAVPGPVEGRERVARLLIDLAAAAPGLTMREHAVNGRPGLVAQHGGTTVAVYAFDVAGERIRHIWVVRNPDKLRPWTAGARSAVTIAGPGPS